MAKSMVTLKDVYEIVQRVEDKMDAQFSDHVKRIRENESFRARATAIFSFLSIFSGVVASYVWERLKGGNGQ